MGVILGIKEDNDKQPVLVDHLGRVFITSSVSDPILVKATESIPVTIDSEDGIAQTQTVSNSRAITKSSQSVSLPEKNGRYILQARGNDVCIETADGAAPTVTALAGGFSLYVMDGQTIETQLAGDYLAFVSAAEAGGIFVLCHKET